MEELIEAVLQWWEDHQWDCLVGDGDEYNVYHEPPEFVQIALKLKSQKDGN